MRVEEVVSVGDSIFLFEISELARKYLTPETWSQLDGAVQLYTISLERVQGSRPVTAYELGILSEKVAGFMLTNPEAVLCYYCDFLNAIPSMRANRPAISRQEYRSLLFSHLFDRYTSSHYAESYTQSIIIIDGDEKYYIHIIAQKDLSPYMDIIANDFQIGYGK